MKIIKQIKEYNLNTIFLHDIPINEKFIMNNNKYIVVPRPIPSCEICFFYNTEECTSVRCSSDEREDCKPVMFIKIS